MTSKENQASTDFSALALSPATLANLQQLGYTQMTPIQAASLPPALLGKDLIAQASTGSGKTAAFALALLANLNPRRFAVQALVLCPTRELADQVTSEIRRLARAEENIKVVTLCGGVPLRAQTLSLEHGAHIVVGTPGRVMDHLERQHLSLEALNTLVLDEADRMLDMGFFDDIVVVAKQCPKERQTLLFSATFESQIKQLALEFMRNPQEVMVTPRNTVAETITHRVHPVDGSRKRDLLLHLLAQDSRLQTLVFARTKHGSDKLATFLEKSGIKTAAIHGNKSQGARQRALSDFKAGRINVLVATDIAARGIDIDQLPQVINFDLPMVAEDYVHRIGRTGRNGSTGQAISLVAQDEAKYLRAIVRLLNRDMDLRDVPGFEPQTPIRWGNSAPGKAEQPGGERTPRRNNGGHKHARRPHGDAPRHAHAGPKKHGGGQRRDGGRSGGARQGQSRPAR